MKICVNNDNFISAVTSLKTKSFFSEDVTYRFLYDGLKSKYKNYMLENELSKDKITIYLTKDKKHAEIIKKYKHQIHFLKSDNLKIADVLNSIFRGSKSHKELISELSSFEARYILTYLEATSITSPVVARISAEIEQYIYSPYFKYLVVYKLYKCGAVVRWIKK